MLIKVIILWPLVKRFLKHTDAEGALFLLHHSQQDRLPATVQENEPTLRNKEQTWVMAEIKPLSQKKNNRDSVSTCSLVFFPIIFFLSNQTFFTGMLAWKIILHMLQVQIKFRLKFFNLGFSTSFVSQPKFMNDQGKETKKIEKQPRLENFNLNLILTCNIYNNNNSCNIYNSNNNNNNNNNNFYSFSVDIIYCFNSFWQVHALCILYAV